MKEKLQRNMRSIEKEDDLISNLPDVLLGHIISFLPSTEECVRTSVLSQRWKKMWKYSSNLSLDQMKMLETLIKSYIQKSDMCMRFESAMGRKIAPNDEEYIMLHIDAISKASILITSILDNHIGPLKSCSIRHSYESCVSGDVLVWMRKLLEKEVMKVSLENEPLNFEPTLYLPFEIFSNFKVLELKNYCFTTKPFSNSSKVLKTLNLNNVTIESNIFHEILSHCSFLENLTIERCNFFGGEVKIDSSSLKYFKIRDMTMQKILISAIDVEVVEIDSIICEFGELVFDTPKLQVLRGYDHEKRHYLCLYGNKLVISWNAIRIYKGILGYGDPSMGSVFHNLVTLSLYCDLASDNNCTFLYLALKSCNQLKNLDINNQVKIGDKGRNDNNESYRGNLSWENKNPCECINRQLKSVHIEGYQGGKNADEFVKYLIRNCGVLEKMNIWFADNCTRDEVMVSIGLFQRPSLSSKLSIVLKPGPDYIRKNGGRFKKWVKTLRRCDD